jgi:hypothetical protein
MDIVIDFDGTCVANEYPQIGRNIGAQEVLIDLVRAGHRLVLSTMRCDKHDQATVEATGVPQPEKMFLKHAVDWFKTQNIPLYGVQVNPGQSKFTTSQKAYGHLIIDDSALGIPLVHPVVGKPYVYWKEVRVMLEKRGLLNVTEKC